MQVGRCNIAVVPKEDQREQQLFDRGRCLRAPRGYRRTGRVEHDEIRLLAWCEVADMPIEIKCCGGPKRGGTTFVVADIPGLIKGASEGQGLGHRFLRHVERTRALLHLLTIDPGEGRDPISDYKAIRHELTAFDPMLAMRPEVVALSKEKIEVLHVLANEIGHTRGREARRVLSLQLEQNAIE